MLLTRRSFQAPQHSYFLFGPRGTGKSTWLRQTYPDALTIDLLAPETLRLYLGHPERLRELVAAARPRRVVVIDEIQKAPLLLNVVHQLIESDKTTLFVLTGSSARKLRSAGVDLLGGRALLKSMHTFLASELGDKFNLDKALQQGMLPLIWDSKQPMEQLHAYVGVYMREEVQAEGIVRNLDSFARFLEGTSFSQGAVLNVTEIARECEVSRTTVQSYLEILKDLLLAFELPIFTRRARRGLTSRPKLYWFDAGVYRSVRPTGPLDRPEEIAGACLEGLVAQHLRGWRDYTDARQTLGFWRTKSGLEVDFVVYGDVGFWAIEVKHTATIRAKDLRGLREFCSDYPEASARCLYRGKESLLIDGVLCMPVDDYLRRVVPGEPLP